MRACPSSRAPLRSVRARRRRDGRRRMRSGNVVMGVAIAAHHVVGGSAHRLKLHVALQRGIDRLHQIDRGRAPRRRNCWRDRTAPARGAHGWRLPASREPLPRAACVRSQGSFRPVTPTSRRNRETTGRCRCAVSAAGESATGMVGGVRARPPGWVIVTRVRSMVTLRSSMYGASTRPDAVLSTRELGIVVRRDHRAADRCREQA